jgi:streptogramin lyase
VVSTLAGTAGVVGSADGTGTAASFSLPSGLAVDGTGNVYVADLGNSIIRKVTPVGVVSTVAGTAGVRGQADGPGSAASFLNPTTLAIDSAGNVYVADPIVNKIRKITPSGVVSTLTVTGASLSFPHGLATDSAGNVYVADTGNNTIRKLTPAGDVATLAGAAGVVGYSDGAGAMASFNGPTGLSTDSNGNLYVADSVNNTIRKITPAGAVSTLAGAPSVSGHADGAGASASFRGPVGLTTDSTGNVYVADTFNNTIRKITLTGQVSTLAGTAGVMAYGNFPVAVGAAAYFAFPYGLASDSMDNVFVVDIGNRPIRKITPTAVVSTVTVGANIHPTGLAIDNMGNGYVTDSSSHTIRKIAPSGEVSTLAGTAGVVGSADGTGALASFGSTPIFGGLTTDGAGNVYMADSSNNTIRKITPTGVVSTLAGTAGVTGHADGVGAAARFNGPTGLAADAAANVYVADFGNHTIRKITPAGVVSTIAGTAGVMGFTPGSLPGVLAYPLGIAISGTSLYVTMGNGVAVVRNVP